MNSYLDDDDGLPDAAFTELERAAGVPDLLRGNGRRRPRDTSAIKVTEEDCIALIIRSLIMLGAGPTCHFYVDDPNDTLERDFSICDLSGLSWGNLSNNRLLVRCSVAGNVYPIAVGTLMNALRRVGVPLFTTDYGASWIGWSAKSKAIVAGYHHTDSLHKLGKNSNLFGPMSQVIVSNPGCAQLFNLLKAAFLSSDHGMKPILVHNTFIQDAIAHKPVPFEHIETLPEDAIEDYSLAYFTKAGTVEAIPIGPAFKERLPIATRTGTYFGGDYGPMSLAFNDDSIWANAFHMAMQHNSGNFCYYLRRNAGSLFEASFERIDMPSELNFRDMRADKVAERAAAIQSWAAARNARVYLTHGRHPLESNFCEAVTTPEHYAHAVKKIETFGFTINNSNTDVSIIWTEANVFARFSEGPYTAPWKPAAA